MATIDPRTGQVLGGIGGFQQPVGPQIGVPGVQPGVPQQQPFVPPTGLIGSEQALQGGLAGALGGLQTGVNQGRRALQPFAGGGVDAQQLQLAQSGALGPAAQQQAFQQFQSSPGQAFLRERGEQAVLRNASALGGLGGGRVQQELQRQGIGFAAQDFGNQFNRLGTLSNQGLQAAGQLGNIGLQGGITAAELARGTGQDLAFGRTRAGEQIAGGISGTTSALADLINQQGTGVADRLGVSGGNLAALLAGTGTAQAGGQDQLAALLAQISQNAGAQSAGLPSLPGTQQTEGILGGVGQLAAGVGGALAAGGGAASLLAFSDSRLKMNVRRIGTTDGGVPWFTWDWTATGARLAGDQPTDGTLAHLVPHATSVGPEGYLMVDYSRIT